MAFFTTYIILWSSLHNLLITIYQRTFYTDTFNSQKLTMSRFILDPKDLPLETSSQPNTQQPKDPLLFGIEIEFSLTTLPLHETDPSPEDPRNVFHVGHGFPRRRIPQTLSLAGILAQSNEDNNISVRTNCMRGTEPEKKNKKTIEFKQHESTLDAERVSNWIRFCVGVCEFADTVELKKLMPFLERHVDRVERFGIGQVIAALGMLLDLVEYYDDYAKKLRAEGKDKKAEQSA
ncbi:hypothetical protein B0J14DRAFT_657450 [Halenospora varia]|nr:hypothetical protein B0J14DRAFT_657450 [Halenospora varia]